MGHGMTVPDGYFADFTARMMERIPQDTPCTGAERRTLWQRVRPYVYMAAMFAGIWLMMNMFTLFQPRNGATDLGGTSSVPMLAELVNTGSGAYVDDFIDISEYDLYNELYDDGYEVSDLISE